MIIIATTIIEEPAGTVVIGFNAMDKDGCTVTEGDIADIFRKSLIKTREEVITKYGWNSKDTLANVYQRTFEDPKDRDKHAEGEK